MFPLYCDSALEIKALPEENEWVLTAPLVWVVMTDGEPFQLIIPRRFITDLASIPRALKNILSVTGKSRRAAVAHDYLYCRQGVSREVADDFLRHALIREGMSAAEARIYWLGVRLGGWIPWNARVKRGGGIFQDDFTAA